MSREDNGKSLISFRHLVFLAGLIFTAGGGWVRLNAQENRIDDAYNKAMGNSQSVALLQQSVDTIKEDVQEISMQQKQQGQLLTDIYIMVKQNKSR